MLNDVLHAYVLETIDDIWLQRAECERHGEQIVTLRTLNTNSSPRPRLIDKITGDIPSHACPLEHVYTAEHFDEALNWLADLEEHQSIITPDGFWLGKGWVKFVKHNEHDEIGFLARQQRIGDLLLVVQELQQKIDVLRIERDQTHQRLQKSLKDNELQQLNVNASNEELRSNTAALSTNEHAIVQAQKNANALILECEELQLFIEETAAKQ